MKSLNDLLDEAWSWRNKHELDAVEELLKEVEQQSQNDDHSTLGRLYHIKRQLSADADDFEQAVKWNALSLEHYIKSGDKDRIAHSMRHLADLEVALDQTTEAIKHYREAMRFYGTSGHPLDIANARRGFAIALESNNETPEAIEQWKRALTSYQQLGLEEGVQEAATNIERLNSV